VNERFADTIASAYEEGDVLFVNDYHLLLPELLRQRLPNATIGFFLHVAFPSSEIFGCLAVREKLLRGLLAADLCTRLPDGEQRETLLADSVPRTGARRIPDRHPGKRAIRRR
jgi:hypothetical protein